MCVCAYILVRVYLYICIYTYMMHITVTKAVPHRLIVYQGEISQMLLAHFILKQPSRSRRVDIGPISQMSELTDFLSAHSTPTGSEGLCILSRLGLQVLL